MGILVIWARVWTNKRSDVPTSLMPGPGGVPNGGRKVAKEVVAERLANMISRQRDWDAVNARRLL